MRPEHTEHYEGFFHLTNLNGTVDCATLQYIIRDHDQKLFEKKKQMMEDAVAYINRLYPGVATLEMKDQYYNMRQQIEPVQHVVEIAKQAMTEAQVEPLVKPIRGGTDGAQLSFKGLPCPNIFAGGLNFHGRYEFVPVPSMQKAMDVIAKIAELTAKQ
jgi:tripeptide aminopeptidase